MEYKKIIEYYFEGYSIDIERILKETNPDDLIVLIKNEIVPNWRQCKQTLQLYNELVKQKFTKPLSHKQYMKELMREKRTMDEIQTEYKKKLEKNNPRVVAQKCDMI